MALSSRYRSNTCRTRLAESRVCRIEQLEQRRLLASNQPPVNHVGGPEEVLVNTPLAFTEFRGNLFSVEDPDAGSNKLRVTLAASHGSISLLYNDPNGGLTYSEGDGTLDVTMTFTGTLANINAAFEWVVFTPDLDYVGTEASITLTTNDQGFVGTGGPKEDVDTIPISVVPVAPFDASPAWETLPAALDATFDGDGKQVLSVSDGVDLINQLLPLDSGKILAVGAVNNHFGLMRFNGDLTLDTTFGVGGVVENDFGDGKHAHTVTMHPDGTFLVGGSDYFAKYETNSTLDSAFGDSGKILSTHANPVQGIAVQADGRILVTGPSSTSKFVASRYEQDGTQDTSYGNASWFIGSPVRPSVSQSLHLRDDGRMVLTGAYFPNNSTISSFSAARINAFGGIESQHAADIGGNHHTSSSISLPDGKILQVGWVDNNVAIVRRLSNGAIDATFGQSGSTILPVLSGEDRGTRASLQSDGKILVVGQAHNGTSWDIAVVRLNNDGSLDSTFVADGTSALGLDLGEGDEFGYDILALPDGKIFVAGRAGDDIALVRLLGDSDLLSPTANLTDPADSSSIDSSILNSRGYLEVTFDDVGGSGLNLASITDSEVELSLTGSGVGSVVLDGAATLVAGSTYRYSFTGTFLEGAVLVSFVPDTFEDQQGNRNEAETASFTVTSPTSSADFDQDGDIDGSDFLAWQRGFGITAGADISQGDSDNDGDVDATDLATWEGTYGSVAAPLATSESLPTTAELIDFAIAIEFANSVETEEELLSEIPTAFTEALYGNALVRDGITLTAHDTSNDDTGIQTIADDVAEVQWLTAELLERVFG